MGALDGTRVLEFAGAGPVPFCGMLLADMGADVVRVDRAADRRVIGLDPDDLMGRGKRSVGIDLSQPGGVSIALRLVESVDVVLEGYRPGVAERIGIGPDACLGRNGRVVYGRGTGFGQHGPLAARAGHDINYVAVAGMLHPIGRPPEPPVPPLSLVADFGGGGMLLTVGVLAALHHAAATGEGQVVDAAMVDGAALLGTVYHELRAIGRWHDERGTNLLDGHLPFYDTYETADGRYVAVGAMEPQFFDALLRLTGLDDVDRASQFDEARHDELRDRLATAFRGRTRDEWAALATTTDACLTPVLELGEAPTHPYNADRDVFVDVDGVIQPAPAPRFSVTPSAVPQRGPRRGEHTTDVLGNAGFGDDELAAYRRDGVIG